MARQLGQLVQNPWCHWFLDLPQGLGQFGAIACLGQLQMACTPLCACFYRLAPFSLGRKG